MSEYRIRETGVVVRDAELRAMHPEKSIAAIIGPEDFEVLGIDIVHPVDPPAVSSFQRAVRNGVAQAEDGRWMQVWVVESWTQDQIDQALAVAKAEKNAQINQWRLAANFKSFTYAGKEIACDQLSRSDIDAVNGRVATRNAFPAGFPGAWKAIDNSYVPIPDVATWNAFYDAMVNQGTANFNKAQQLKAQLVGASTLAEVEAIAW